MRVARAQGDQPCCSHICFRTRWKRCRERSRGEAHAPSRPLSARFSWHKGSGDWLRFAQDVSNERRRRPQVLFGRIERTSRSTHPLSLPCLRSRSFTEASDSLGSLARCRTKARRFCRRTGARARSASFTDTPVGNTSRTSGSITTTFAPCAYRADVAPRTAWEKSYSGRIVSRSFIRRFRLPFFFISPPLLPSGPPCRNETGSGWSLGKRHHQKSPLA